MLKADLNWLPTSLFKGISYPEVIYEEDTYDNYGGYYTHGTNRLVIVEDSTVASAIAHEFRHYLQYINGFLEGSKGSKWKIEGTYEDSIHKYFTTQPTEMDALLFQVKHANDWCSEWWLRKLVRRN